MGFSMNLAVLHEGLRRILEETKWMDEMVEEWANEGRPLVEDALSARALVRTLEHAARDDAPKLIDAFWRRLGEVAALSTGTRPEEYPDVVSAGRQILNSLYESATPLGHLIETLEVRELGGRLAMLLMGGMTGVFEALTLMRNELEPFLATWQGKEGDVNRKSVSAGGQVGGP